MRLKNAINDDKKYEPQSPRNIFPVNILYRENDTSPTIRVKNETDSYWEYSITKKKVAIKANNPFAPSAIFPALIKPTIITTEITKIIGVESRLYILKIFKFRGRISFIKIRLVITIKTRRASLLIDDNF